MTTLTETTAIVKEQLKTQLPDIQPGDTIRVHQKIKEGDPSSASGQVKERIQVFEGLVLARKHGKGINATITVRKVSKGVAVERIFPIHAPFIQKIEIVKRAKVRRAKLYYLREAKGKKARLKATALGIEVAEPEKIEEPKQEEAPETPKKATEEPKEK